MINLVKWFFRRRDKCEADIDEYVRANTVVGTWDGDYYLITPSTARLRCYHCGMIYLPHGLNCPRGCK